MAVAARSISPVRSVRESFVSPVLAALLLTLAVAGWARAEPPAADAGEADSLFDLSIEELVEVQVTSVAGMERSWFDTPAAITVITGQELLDSGLTTVGEALRLVPGMHVGRVDSRQWAVTARGFSDLFSNKLQVLIDGRVVYNELFGGVYWDVQDPLLEDIDRIEVIRGPGATLWGANAVNGVVNVITKSTADTVGNYVGGGGGNEEHGFVGARHGGAIGELGSYRVWGRYIDRDSSKREVDGRQRPDHWNLGTGGFQVEQILENGIALYLQGQAHSSDRLGQATLGPTGAVISGDGSSIGGHVLARVSGGDPAWQSWTLQSYYDVESRISADDFGDRRDTWDVDFRQQLRLEKWGVHDVVWGGGYRHRRQRTDASPALRLSPANRSTNLAAGFIQDTVTLVEDRLFLMLGSKLEYNSFTSFEIQPSGRLWWTPDERLTLWTAISRPVRMPTLVEEDLVFVNPVTTLRGDRDLDAETTIAYELGGRVRPTPELMFDVAAFFNDHDDLIMRSPVSAGNEVFANVGSANGYGVELSAMWQALARLSFEGSYSYYRLDAGSDATEMLEGASPRHQFQIHSQLDVSERLSVNAAVYYVSRIPRFSIDSYFRLDVGILWQPVDGVELAVFGQNLIGDHPEYFQRGRVDTQPEIERGVYGRVRLNF